MEGPTISVLTWKVVNHACVLLRGGSGAGTHRQSSEGPSMGRPDGVQSRFSGDISLWGGEVRRKCDSVWRSGGENRAAPIFSVKCVVKVIT